MRAPSLRMRAAAGALSSGPLPDDPSSTGTPLTSSSSSGAAPDATWPAPLPGNISSFRLPAFQPWSLGKPLAWGFLLGYILFMLVLPIAALLGKASLVPLAEFWARATEPVALSAYYVSFSMSIVAALINCVFGFILAWVLVKFEFPGERLAGARGIKPQIHMTTQMHMKVSGIRGGNYPQP